MIYVKLFKLYCPVYTKDLVIFACLNFREFVILKLHTSRIRELAISMIGISIMIIISRYSY